jgi:predicted nucleotidyltransferase
MITKLYRANQEERTRIIDQVGTELRRDPQVAFAYLYGSFQSADSFHDVDIGIYLTRCKADQDTRYVLALTHRLADLVPFPIDVRILNHAPVPFLYHVLSGRPLLIQDEELLTNLMEQVVREYLDMAPLLKQSTREAFAV